MIKAIKFGTEKKCNIRINIFGGVLFIILLMLLFIYMRLPNVNKVFGQQGDIQLPVILNSDMVTSEEAAIKYIVWSECLDKLPDLEKVLQGTGMIWHKLSLSDFSGRKVYKYTSELNAKKENEAQAIENYFLLVRQLSGLKAKAFFEERVDSLLDYNRFIGQNKIETINSIKTPEMISITGYDMKLPIMAKVGDDKVNIQIISYPKNELEGICGKTVIAYPALFEDF